MLLYFEVERRICVETRSVVDFEQNRLKLTINQYIKAKIKPKLTTPKFQNTARLTRPF
jgi:hypothetical protein